VWAYSKKRAVRGSQALTAQANRGRAVTVGEKRPQGTRFVTVHVGDTSLDEASLAKGQVPGGRQGLRRLSSHRLIRDTLVPWGL